MDHSFNNKITDILSITSSSTCSELCGFDKTITVLAHKKNLLSDRSELECDGAVDEIETVQQVEGGTNSVNAMELMRADEIFEVNSNSTTDTLKEQRLARNEELRLKATYLVSRRPVKNQLKEYHSESSSEFPASSPSNPRMHRKSQYQSRPPLLKNTLPADAFERGLALIATKEPQMTMNEKIESWKCATEEFSDVEDVVNFDAVFEQREENKIRLLSKTKSGLKNKSASMDSAVNDTCYSFTEFQRRLLAIDSNKRHLSSIQQKHKSKFTSEEDEKPTTSSNCLTRNRDTPLKKRVCKYKRAAEPTSHLPNKKSSSSDAPRDGAPNAKKKAQQQKLSPATAAGEEVKFINEKMICPSSSEASSQLVRNENITAGISARNLRSQAQTKPKSSKMIETTTINTIWNKAISSTNSARNEEQDSFFRWRRLSREIDKVGNIVKTQKTSRHHHKKGSPSRENKGLIQIRYDFMKPTNTHTKEVCETNTYNVVVKTLKKEDVFKEPKKSSSMCNASKNSILEQNNKLVSKHTRLNSEELVIKTEELKKTEPVDNINNKDVQDSGAKFHQQHEFCNYLGLTGMSTANAMATAAAELSKCNLARRSLRVRHLEQRKAKTKTQLKVERIKEELNNKEKPALTKKNPDNMDSVAISSDKKTREFTTRESKTMANSTSLCATSVKSEAEGNGTHNAALNSSEPCMQKVKEKETKIQILCQIAASSKKEEEEARIKCVEQLTAPIRKTLQQQCQLTTKFPAAIANASNQIKTSKCNLHINNDRIEGGKDDTKYIELIANIPNKKNSVDSLTGASEVQTLHEKVQRCLEQARQNTPNIFIVQSLDSTLVTEKSLSENLRNESKPNKTSAIDIKSSKSKLSLRSNKSTQVNHTESAKEKKRRGGGSMKKSKSGNRRLYTRSMLNLNQQRELRNRKVILKLLKTYSGLKIKVSKPKNKRSIADKGVIQDDGKTEQMSEQNKETEINIPFNSEEGTNDSVVIESDKNNMNKEESSENIDVTSSKANIEENFLSMEPILKENNMSNITHDHVAEHITSNNNENIAVLDKENTSLASIGNILQETFKDPGYVPATSSSTLKSKYQDEVENSHSVLDIKLSTVSVKNLSITSETKTDKNEVAVQTDPTTPIQPLSIFVGRSICSNQDTIHLTHINAEMDVSSSDMVTSTTSGVGDHNRCGKKTPSNLVTKELYRNRSFAEESIIGATDALHSEASSLSQSIELNPLVNVSISSTINNLGIHALREPSRALRNPLRIADGSVLHIYFELDTLIVVQESLISFWKYMRVLNALMVKPNEANVDELHGKSKFTNSCSSREMPTPELQSSAATVDFRSSDLDDMSSSLISGCEWVYLGEKKRLCTDIEIESSYMNRLCLSESRPVYIEMRCRELLNAFRECNLLSCYVNVYFFNEEDQVATCHSIQLDSIQSIPSDVIYTAINDSRYFVLAWPQANVLGKVRSGLCKYALTPELDMLATTRDFKAMRHVLRSLECLSDGKLLGFGDTQLTVWDHRSGDVLMNYDLSMPLGQNLGTIYYPSLENGQNNVVLMIQNVRNEASSDLVIIACSISHLNPSRRVLLRHRLPTPPFYNIRSGVNNGEHFVIQSNTGEEILISCNDPRQIVFVPAQRSERFYTRGRTQIIELTNQTLTVDSFSSYLLKIAAGINNQKPIAENRRSKKNWCA